jgi:hypothetical protein
VKQCFESHLFCFHHQGYWIICTSVYIIHVLAQAVGS